MSAYFYHLKLEIYPAPNLKGPRLDYSAVREGRVWIPDSDADIFGHLPSHPRRILSGSRPLPTDSRHLTTRPATPNTTVPQLSPKKPPTSIIDCGSPRPPDTRDDRTYIRLPTRPHHDRTPSFPPPKSQVAINPHTAAKDWRFGRLNIESIDNDISEIADTSEPDGSFKAAMAADQNASSSAAPAAAPVGPIMGGTGKPTKAKYVPLSTKNTEIGWGIVHLYRELRSSDELLRPPEPTEQDQDGAPGSDCTTICIPAVPSYLSPSDFLGFIGDKWRDCISHYRMVMTGRLNRYLVLIKFRNATRAQRFQHEFDGKVFNDIEPETCNVAFIRSVTFETSAHTDASFPDLSHDPFTPPSTGTAGSLKPFPPPTPDLVELPTCPVCLERMDDTTGLLTILCQHVFHCSCLQKWRGSGCPVCRHTNPSTPADGGAGSTAQHDPANPYTQPFGSSISNLCSVCDAPDDLWICLICGNVGCGRYKGGHAKEHWKDTAHTFSLELDTQHVWDYAGDMWVHRLIRDKGDGKVVELPSHRDDHGESPERNTYSRQNEHHDDHDVVPRAKFESMGMEYTHLLTSQLESQRVYFEEMLSKAADKAAKATAAAEAAGQQAAEAAREVRAVREDQAKLRDETLPSLERDLERERARAGKSTELARSLGRSLQDEKKVSEGLLRRVEHVNAEVEALRADNADLRDQNHDLSMFISGQQKLKEMTSAEGSATAALLDEEEVQAGSVEIPAPEERKGRRKGKGRAK